MAYKVSGTPIWVHGLHERIYWCHRVILHSSNALWLFSAVPVWYFAGVAHPFKSGMLSFIPFLGTVGLVAGGLSALVQRRRALLLFAFPFLLSEAYVFVAGRFEGQFRGSASLLPEWLFLITQAALIAHLVYKSRQTWLTSLALAVFSLSYALFALFIGGMAFAEDWL